MWGVERRGVSGGADGGGAAATVCGMLGGRSRGPELCPGPPGEPGWRAQMWVGGRTGVEQQDACLAALGGARQAQLDGAGTASGRRPRPDRSPTINRLLTGRGSRPNTPSSVYTRQRIRWKHIRHVANAARSTKQLSGNARLHTHSLGSLHRPAATTAGNQRAKNVSA